MIRNVHRRHLPVEPAEVWALVARFGTPDDDLWPPGWPPARLDGPLEVGTAGGHGPIAYVVDAVDAGRSVSFRFTAPAGFRGHHRFEVVPAGTGASEATLEHHLEVTADLPARVVWWVALRPLHDALLEELLDRAERATTGGLRGRAASRGPWVRLLRRLDRRAPRPARASAPAPEVDGSADRVRLRSDA